MLYDILKNQYGIPLCYCHIFARRLPKKFRKKVGEFYEWEVPQECILVIVQAWQNAREEWKKKRGKKKFLEILEKHARKVRRACHDRGKAFEG
ncbi:MAG: hypothetical protein ACPLRS_05115 [Hydrogenobacter sp.]